MVSSKIRSVAKSLVPIIKDIHYDKMQPGYLNKLDKHDWCLVHN